MSNRSRMMIDSATISPQDAAAQIAEVMAAGMT